MIDRELACVEIKPIPYDQDRQVNVCVLIDPSKVRAHVARITNHEFPEVQVMKAGARFLISTFIEGVELRIEMEDRKDESIRFGQSCCDISRIRRSDNSVGSSGPSEG